MSKLNMAQRYGDVYRLREEALKGWENFITDEAIYGVEYFGDVGVTETRHLDAYIKGDIWFEFLVTTHDNQLVWALVESGTARQMELCMRVEGDIALRGRIHKEAVLRAITEFSQDGQEVDLRPMRSVVRLKCFDDWDWLRQYVRQTRHSWMKLTLSGSSLLAQRELGIARLLSTGEVFHGKLVNDEIEGSPKVADRITDDQSPLIGNGPGPSERERWGFGIAFEQSAHWCLLVPPDTTLQRAYVALPALSFKDSVVEFVRNHPKPPPAWQSEPGRNEP